MNSKHPERRVWRPDIAGDVADEVAYHLEMREQDMRARGFDQAAARETARQRFGDVKKISAQCVAIDERQAREQRRAGMWTDFRQDVSYAFRGIRRAPGFAVMAMLTLALGIGGNTAIFSVIDSVLLRPLPFAQPERLVFVWSTSHDRPVDTLTPGRMVDFRDQSTSFSGFAGISHLSLTLTGSGDPELLPGSSVSSSFFDVLGTTPLIGDTFHTGAADPSAVVLSYPLWTRRFGSDRSLIGRTIVLNGAPRQVVAVMRPDFAWPSITVTPSLGPGPELWIPAGPRDIPRTAVGRDDDLSANRSAGYLRAVARLKPAITTAQATGELNVTAERLGRMYPDDAGHGATLVPLRQQLFGAFERPLLVLGGAVAFVLAIACANVASLVLGRGVARRRDLALRRALGASRMRVVRQLLTEAVVLSFCGAGGGLLFAWWGSAWLVRLSPGGVLRLDHAGIDGRVLIFTVLLSIVTGIAFGVVPALQLSRGDLTEALGDGGARSSAARGSGRTRDVLVIAEIAVALVLLVGSTLLVRSFMTLTRVDTGIDTRNLLTFDVVLTGDRAQYQAKQVQFYDALLDRIRALPGVQSAGAAVTLPIGGDDFAAGYAVEGRAVPTRGQEPHAGYQTVTPGYFRTMGMSIRHGRDVRPSDTHDAQPITLVNETLARLQWPGEDAVGRRLRFGGNTWMTIVGVVSDIRHLGPSTPPRPEIYQPDAQASFPFMAFVVRTGGDPYALVSAIRHAVSELDSALPISGVSTMDEHIARSLARPRFLSTLVASFGALAVALAVVGIYGMMTWSVVQRRREIAIRMALGAAESVVLRMVLRKALALAVSGVACGLLGALLATRALAGLLYGVTATDGATFAGTAASITAVAVLAAIVPAWRAARIRPVAILNG